ncbi:MAG: creatininase family protein [Ottowia sp.]|uniref:creatininase family protein n=1 Tax=Ottowia sp. TaxID=1898956 RepID=UPI0039E21CAF
MSARPILPPRSRQWSDLATTDFSTLDLARAIAVLPLGATEQHGPHLPLSVDANLAHSMVEASARALPPDLPVLFLPVQRIGYSPEHGAYPGTLSLKADTVIRLWTDIAEGVSASGVNKLVLFNTHGGNVGLLDVVARDLRARLGMLAYSVNWFDLPLKTPEGEDVMARFTPEELRFGVHGGQVETSIMMALKPRLVRLSKARNFASSSESRARDFRILGNGKSAKLAWMAQDLHPSGCVGNAVAANADDGVALLDAAGRALAELLVEIDRLPSTTLRGVDAPAPPPAQA